ncbi:thiazole synthase [Fodinicurvata fenggangensis]|uniref:thiazole synthase n=1 Tax=Fodinicurvata fenggangensis TaxID=1121830 RepID=UPI00047BE9BC|nr:thiazole synthase [Fodinicurvata fenggangensis]
MSDDTPLTIADRQFSSRVFLGTSAYPNLQVMLDCVEESGTELVTLSIRRLDLEGYAESPVDLLEDYDFLPNTAGCETARDAILTAQLARESLETNWVKLEIIGDRETLYPDVEQLLSATDELVKDGFTVLPYCNDDPVICKRLADLGAAAVMPMGSLIGSGMGVANPANIELICRQAEVPVVIDAGLGTASDVVQSFELGCDAVLLNTAVARARNPVAMARAVRHAAEAGRAAHLAGRIPKRPHAEASSPQMGLVGS